MNLQELKSSLPKPWLNISANSLNSNSTYSKINISNGPISTNGGSGTLDITPENLVNGVLGCTSTTTLSVQLPTASDINNYVNLLQLTPQASFKFTICTSGAPGPISNTSVILNTGITTFNGAPSITVATGVQKDLIFLYSSGSWVIYF